MGSIPETAAAAAADKPLEPLKNSAKLAAAAAYDDAYDEITLELKINLIYS